MTVKNYIKSLINSRTVDLEKDSMEKWFILHITLGVKKLQKNMMPLKKNYLGNIDTLQIIKFRRH